MLLDQHNYFILKILNSNLKEATFSLFKSYKIMDIELQDFKDKYLHLIIDLK